MKKFGEFSKSFITDIPADLKSIEARHYKKTIPRFPDEAVFIYSFKENKMVYADGWEDIFGYKDDEINMLTIVSITAPQYAPFSNDLNDAALKFILNKTENLEKYSFCSEVKKLHKNGEEIPVLVRVGVHEVENNRMVSIIGNYRLDRSLHFGNVMRYAAYGPEKNEFEEELNKSLFTYPAISSKEREALALAAKGLSFKEIAHCLKVSNSAIEKRIIPMYKRFDVKSLTHLVSFAYDNQILP